MDALPTEVLSLVAAYLTNLDKFSRTCTKFVEATNEGVLLNLRANPLRLRWFFSADPEKTRWEKHCVTVGRTSNSDPSETLESWETLRVGHFLDHFVYEPNMVKITETDFTIAMRFRADAFPQHNRAILMADWVHPWSWMIMYREGTGPWMELRRNIDSGGSDPKQGMIAKGAGVGASADGKWHTLAFMWNRTEGQLGLVYDGVVCGEPAKVFPHVTKKHPDVDSAGRYIVQKNNHEKMFLGSKNDSTEKLEGFISHIAIFRKDIGPEAALRVCADFDADPAAELNWASIAAQDGKLGTL